MLFQVITMFQTREVKYQKSYDHKNSQSFQHCILCLKPVQVPEMLYHPQNISRFPKQYIAHQDHHNSYVSKYCAADLDTILNRPPQNPCWASSLKNFGVTLVSTHKKFQSIFSMSQLSIYYQKVVLLWICPVVFNH